MGLVERSYVVDSQALAVPCGSIWVEHGTPDPGGSLNNPSGPSPAATDVPNAFHGVLDPGSAVQKI